MSHRLSRGRLEKNVVFDRVTEHPVADEGDDKVGTNDTSPHGAFWMAYREWKGLWSESPAPRCGLCMPKRVQCHHSRHYQPRHARPHTSEAMADGRMSTPAPTVGVTLWKGECHHFTFLDGCDYKPVNYRQGPTPMYGARFHHYINDDFIL
ncbi:hypothetical protein SDJN03_22831, partial [Cucurbita argyrosperma subsp. sororia]